MKVNNNLEVVVARPGYGLLQIRQLTRDVGLSGADIECPVADRNPDVVETASDAFKFNMGSIAAT